MEYQCTQCGKQFARKMDRDNHCRSTGHSRQTRMLCGECHVKFVDQQALNQHSCLSAPDARRQFRCRDCNRTFVNQTGSAKQVQDEVQEPKSTNRPQKIPCDLCNKSFRTQRGMMDHMSSRTHNPLCSPFQCIGSNECAKVFDSPSSMILHLESSFCPSGLTRETLNRVIVHQDTERIITHPLSPGGAESPVESDNSGSVDGGAILTPLSSSFSLLQRTRSSSSLSDSWELIPRAETSWASSPPEAMTPQNNDTQDIGPDAALLTLFVCPLCKPTSKPFRTARDLDNHRTSPVHDVKLFHTPTAIYGDVQKKTARKNFSTFSGLAMHVESEAYGGGKKKIQWVLQLAKNLLKGLGIAEAQLLS